MNDRAQIIADKNKGELVGESILKWEDREGKYLIEMSNKSQKFIGRFDYKEIYLTSIGAVIDSAI